MSIGKEKLIIYQLFPRIFTNTNPNCVPWGTLQQNGSGKLNDFYARVAESYQGIGRELHMVHGRDRACHENGFQ